MSTKITSYLYFTPWIKAAAIDRIIEDKEISALVRQCVFHGHPATHSTNICQVKYLNNIVEQDHRAVKRVTKQMLGFKSFQSAKNDLAGIELRHMIGKGQMVMEGGARMSFADQFYALAGQTSTQKIERLAGRLQRFNLSDERNFRPKLHKLFTM